MTGLAGLWMLYGWFGWFVGSLIDLWLVLAGLWVVSGFTANEDLRSNGQLIF